DWAADHFCFTAAWWEDGGVEVAIDVGAAVGVDIEGGFDLGVDPGLAGGGGAEFFAEAGFFPDGKAHSRPTGGGGSEVLLAGVGGHVEAPLWREVRGIPPVP